MGGWHLLLQCFMILLSEPKPEAAAREKTIQIAEKLRAMKLAKAAQKVADGIEETLTYMDFPTQH